MKFATLIGAAAAFSDYEIENNYLTFIATHGKSYGTEEEYKFRLAVYTKNVIAINEHNQGIPEGDNSARMGVNSMADWTQHEYKKLLGFRSSPINSTAEIFDHDGADLPASVDWRTKGAVTPVKNQASCGSCWAFSTTGSMEGRYQIAGNTLTSFSEQQFVDCSKNGNQGCNGGLMDNAFKFAETQKIETEAAYPYTGKDGTCTESGGVTEVKGYADVTTKSEAALRAAVAAGPVSVAVDGASLGFQLYFGGIVKHFCGTSLDHGVLAVGYGTDNGTGFWLVKNSWGASWGEKGYIRILRTENDTSAGLCGIQLQPSFPSF